MPTHTLCFKDQIIGTILDSHRGLGWMHARIAPAESFFAHAEFAREFREIHKQYEDSNERKEMIRKLRKKSGELLDHKLWTVKEDNTRIIAKMQTVPLLYEYKDYVNATWKPKD